MKNVKIILVICLTIIVLQLSGQSGITGVHIKNFRHNIDGLCNINSYISGYCDEYFKDIVFDNPEFGKVFIGTEEYFLDDYSLEYFKFLNSLNGQYKCKLLYLTDDYINELSQELKLLGMPLEIAYLPLIVSSFDLYYNDNSRGFGIWGLQYVPAVRYGLDVDLCYDERLDIRLSSKASLLYLKELYSIYKSWDYAITAFCVGPARLNKSMGGNNYYFEDVINDLSLESGNTFYRFLALILWINKYHSGHNIEFPEKHMVLMDTVEVNTRMNFSQISEVLSIDIDTLNNLNPLYLCNIIDGTSKIRKIALPSGKGDSFVSNYDSISHYKDSIFFPVKDISTMINTGISKPNPDDEEMVYKVVSGDNLGSIARRYGVKIAEIQDWNDIRGTNIYVGQKLTLFVKKEFASGMNSTADIIESGSDKYKDYEFHSIYEVKQGDSLYTIAKKYDWVSAEDIMIWNKIKDPSKLKIGQKLEIFKKR